MSLAWRTSVKSLTFGSCLWATRDSRAAAKAVIATFVRNWIASERQKRRPPCRHGGLESREETPKEGICGRSCRTATISSLVASVARAFFVKNKIAVFHSARHGRDPWAKGFLGRAGSDPDRS